MPLYRVNFKGWAVIEADSMEEAEEEFCNGEGDINITNEEWKEID